MFSETLPDSEDKIIERLGDCDQVPVEYMDLLSHRVRCHKIEIFHYNDEVSFTPNDEEEEQELSYGPLFSEDHTDDEDRTLELVNDVDCLIKRIEQMQMVIRNRKNQEKLELQSEVTEASTEQQKSNQSKHKDKLSCEEQLEVRNQHHAHYRLQCEIDEMICNYRLLRNLQNKLRSQMCQENKYLRKLGALSRQYKHWSNTVARELTVCKQRYLYHLEKKLSKSEAHQVINANLVKALKRGQTFVTKRRLSYDLQEFHLEIKELMEYANDLKQEMIRRFNISQETQPVSDQTNCPILAPA